MLKITRSSFGVVARIRGLPDKADELRRRLLDLARLTRFEAGCISCEMIENGCDSTEFTLLEEWSDAEAHRVHLGTIVIRSALQFLPNLLSSEVGRCRQVRRLNAVIYGANSYCLSVS